MVRILGILSVLFIGVFLSSCDNYFGERTNLDFIEIPTYDVREISYVPIAPNIQDAIAPVDVYIGYDEFIYVDRIAVSLDQRDKGIGSKLYEKVIAYSQENTIPIAAEVNLNPPNPGSMRFHHRFEFEEVGILHHKEKSVTMLLR